MILKALKYTRYAGNAREWSIIGRNEDYAYFDNMNLLVGKNASGKSRTLDVIREIGQLFSKRASVKKTAHATERFDLLFENGKDKYRYFLDYKDKVIVTETLTLNGKTVLDRAKNELIGADGKTVPFTIVDTILAITLSDDNGHDFFEPFTSWGESLKNYLFSNQSEKNHLVKDYTVIKEGDYDVEDTSVLVYTFHQGMEAFGESFLTEIKNCLHDLGYDYISNIGIEEQKAGFGIAIEEYGQYMVSQRNMSQGLFRVLALCILLVYARRSKLSICILVDDIGEGLDYEKSNILIDIVNKKIHNSNIQFLMTTNDRHIMNKIPLRFWTVVDGQHAISVFYDYTNSKEVYEDFRYTGLNNFDFLTTDFYSKGFGEIDEDEDDEEEELK